MDHNIEIAHAETRARIDDIYRTAAAVRSAQARRRASSAAHGPLRVLAGAALVRLGTIILGEPYTTTPDPAVASQ